MTAVLAVADTDSYLKWGAATLTAMPADWHRSMLVIDNPVAPSRAQIEGATSIPVEICSRAAVLRRIRAEAPDAVLLACTGPVVAQLADGRGVRGRNRAVLITGLPGISIPATARAVSLRRGCDLFLLHSHREITEFAALASQLAPHLQLALARLPFLSPNAGEVALDRRQGGDLIFAAQAKVPADRTHREAIVRALAAAGFGADHSPSVHFRRSIRKCATRTFAATRGRRAW
jgi:Putative glycosyltransferase (DUF6716)